MRLPIPKTKLVAFTLAGALLTAVIAGGLAFPIPGVTGGDTGSDSGTQSTGAPQSAADVPTPNQDFTPAVQTQTGYEGEEHEEYEEDDEDEHEEYEDDEDEGEHEEREAEHDDEYEDEDEAE
ncbi:hypothetical protein [Haloplanus rubicundus]|uniref:Uncharacterized protein n=1 Tax=Haloplanus rubicundus TaxID=1547898 RepID=A0A345EEG2_9EURY|nr:hypothetical protein [Haloplanus rubicundus]AXG10584.1 hypothetical protein DU484_12420 [Haloplanus rubicundus]